MLRGLFGGGVGWALIDDAQLSCVCLKIESQIRTIVGL